MASSTVKFSFTALGAQWFVYSDGIVSSNTGFVFSNIRYAGTLVQKAYAKAKEAIAEGRKPL